MIAERELEIGTVVFSSINIYSIVKESSVVLKQGSTSVILKVNSAVFSVKVDKV